MERKVESPVAVDQDIQTEKPFSERGRRALGAIAALALAGGLLWTGVSPLVGGAVAVLLMLAPRRPIRSIIDLLHRRPGPIYCLILVFLMTGMLGWMHLIIPSRWDFLGALAYAVTFGALNTLLARWKWNNDSDSR